MVSVVAEERFPPTAGFSQWRNLLITKEDVRCVCFFSLPDTATHTLLFQPFHLHKTLGICCLLSFVWRIWHIGVDTDMGFRSHPHLTVPTLTLHLLLNLSSFVFAIPHRRIKEGSRIWPEYRYHSLVFSLRSLATILLYWYEQTQLPITEEPYYYVNVLIVLFTLAGADLSTMSAQQYASKSIRNLEISRGARYFFTVCQFYATAGVLFGVRRYTLQFLNVFVVQINPFLFTLRRKNLISHVATLALYGILLLFGFTVSVYEYTSTGGMILLRTVAFIGNLAIVWRTSSVLCFLPPALRRFLQSKYLIWTVLGILAQHLRPHAFFSDVSIPLRVPYAGGTIAMLLNGFIKCRSRDYDNDDPLMGKVEDSSTASNGSVKNGTPSHSTKKLA